MSRRIWYAGLLAAALLAGTGIAGAACKLQAFLNLPITMAGSRPLVSVKLNGVEAHLLLDTGAFFSFVSPEAASRAGLNVGFAPQNLLVEGLGGEVRPGLATVKDFTIGGQAVHRVQLLVYGDRFSGEGVDGILGQNILRLGDIEIDLANGMARLFKPDGCGHANLAYWAGSTPVGVLGIRYTEPTAPHVVADAQVNGIDIAVMFDTGAGASGLSLQAAEKAGVTPRSPGVVPGGLRGGVGNGEVDSWIAPFRSFRLDTEDTRNTHLRISDLRDLPRNADMLLGADFFLSHHVLISYSQRRIFFTYNGGPVFDLRVRGAAPMVDAVPSSAPTEPAAAPTSAPAAAANGAELDRRASASVARGDLPTALDESAGAIAAEPANPLYRLHRAQTLVRSGDVKQATADLDEALRLQPGLTDALMLRGSLRIRANDLQGARSDFAAAESGAPGRFELPLEEVGVYTSAGRYQLALELLDRWIAAHPQDERRYDALEQRCLLRGMLGRELDDALADCNAARRHVSSNSLVLYDRGIVQLRRKAYDKAIADFSDTLALQPRLARALYARGLARIGKGDRAGGDADLAAALALEPRIARLFRDVDLGP